MDFVITNDKLKIPNITLNTTILFVDILLKMPEPTIDPKTNPA